jgi:hypothetical protein
MAMTFEPTCDIERRYCYDNGFAQRGEVQRPFFSEPAVPDVIFSNAQAVRSSLGLMGR